VLASCFNMDEASLQKSFSHMTSLLQEQLELQRKQVELQQQQFNFFQSQSRNGGTAAHQNASSSASTFTPTSLLPSSAVKAWQISDADEDVTEVKLDKSTPKHPVPPEEQKQQFSPVAPLHSPAAIDTRSPGGDRKLSTGSEHKHLLTPVQIGSKKKQGPGGSNSHLITPLSTPPSSRSILNMSSARRLFQRGKATTKASNMTGLTIINDMDREAENVSEYGKMAMKRLITVRVFTFFRNTILMDGDVLLKECLIPLAFYFLTGVLVVACYQGSDDGDLSEVLKYTYGNAKAVPSLMQFPMAIFLGTYLYQSYFRWVWLRFNGIGALWKNILKLIFALQLILSNKPAASGQLSSMEHAVAACRRYGRASLMLVFLCRRVKTGYDEEIEFGKLPLNVQEKRILANLKGGYAEAMWVWMAHALKKYEVSGELDGDQCGDLVGICVDSHAVITQMYAYLDTPLPFRWAHLLCFFVKLHNITLAISGGFVLGAYILSRQFDQEYEVLDVVKMTMHLSVTPFVYNAILILCMEMQFPVDGSGTTDFPMLAYDSSIETDCQALLRGREQWNLMEKQIARDQKLEQLEERSENEKDK